MKPTPEYEAALRSTQQFHTKNKGFSGRFLLRYLDDVRKIVIAHGCHSMLDYGCGRGVQYEGTPCDGQSVQGWLGIQELAKFDPGFAPFSREPSGRYDLVICTQVLGSIPITDLPWVLDRICSYAIKAVYVAEVLNDAPRKTLHESLARSGKMPHAWDVGRWGQMIGAAAARHPNIAVYLRTKDKRTGSAGKKEFIRWNGLSEISI